MGPLSLCIPVEGWLISPAETVRLKLVQELAPGAGEEVSHEEVPGRCL